MNCLTFEELLDRLLRGELDSTENVRATRHVQNCKPCRELHRLMIGKLALFPPPVPENLAESILERTSGSACGRAHQLLCTHADGQLEATDSNLLELHLQSCPGCAALSTTLTRLGEDLPALSHLSPDHLFVGDVLAVTGAGSQPALAVLPESPGALERWAARLKQIGSAWALRPRFAWEASYVGAMLIALVFGAPASPLSGIPSQALAMVQANPVARVVGTREPGEMRENYLAIRGGAWEITGGLVIDLARSARTDVERRYARTRDARIDLHQHGTEAWIALQDGNYQRGNGALHDVSGDVFTFWKRFVFEDDETSDPADRIDGTSGSQA